jgi:putative lipoic acid-binding regulatory protein
LIEYPCSWIYRVLGSDETALRVAIAEVIEEREHVIEAGNVSRTGRYCSLHLRVVVASDADRLGLLRGLQTRQAVRYVL